MKNIYKTQTTLFILAVVIQLAFSFFLFKNFNTPATNGSISNTGMNDIFTVASTSGTTVTTSSSLLTASSSSRQYIRITNVGSQTIFLQFNDIPAVVNQGIAITASSSYSVDPLNLYHGAIRAISAAGTQNITYVEK